MKNTVKAAACFTAACLAATAAFAQITVDLDVLTEDFIPKDALTSAPLKTEDASVALKAPEQTKPAEQTEKKEAKKEEKRPAAKNAPEKKAAAKPKPVVKPTAKTAAKPAVKKAAAPKKPEKPAVKKTAAVKPVEKFHVKESAQSDEHDRLKPRANPVPKVKILAAENSSHRDNKNAAEENAGRSDAPKLSKHFLEQERLKERRQTEEKETAAAEKPAVKQAEAKPVEKPRPLMETAPDTLSVQPKTLLRAAGGTETPAEKTAAAKQPVRFSVFPVSSKLTPEERSARLAQEIPQDSATATALKRNRSLYHIFIFETGATLLGEEMQAALDTMAEQLKKDPSKRVLLYSYSAPDPVRTGGERQHSLRRALAVRSYLAQQGINTLRMEIRSFGKKGAGSKIPDRTDILIMEK